MSDRHGKDTGDRAGEGHRSRIRRIDRGIGVDADINTPVTGITTDRLKALDHITRNRQG